MGYTIFFGALKQSYQILTGHTETAYAHVTQVHLHRQNIHHYTEIFDNYSVIPGAHNFRDPTSVERRLAKNIN